MNKKMLIITAVLVAVIAGSVVFVLMKNGGKEKQDQSTSQNMTRQTSESTETTSPTKGTYETYSAEALANAKGTILLFFHAPWCPQCRAIEKSITEGGLPDNTTVLKVDYDSHQDLRQKYGVTLQTTFVKVDPQGNKLGSYVAYDEPTFSSVQRELLP